MHYIRKFDFNEDLSDEALISELKIKALNQELNLSNDNKTSKYLYNSGCIIAEYQNVIQIKIPLCQNL